MLTKKLKIYRGLNNLKSFWLIFFTLSTLNACQPVNPVKSAYGNTGNKVDAKIDSRAEWRNLLGWREDCEQSFSSTHASNDSGIEQHMLSNNDQLVIVMCAVGSYQPSFQVYFIHGIVAKQLELETYTATDGLNLVRSYEQELWGEPVFFAKSQTLVIFNSARQTGDCGTWAKYSTADDDVRLLDFRYKLPCLPNVIQAAVNTSSDQPPQGWKRFK